MKTAFNYYNTKDNDDISNTPPVGGACDMRQ